MTATNTETEFFDGLARYSDSILCVCEDGTTATYGEVLAAGKAALGEFDGRPLVFLCAENTIEMIGCYLVCLQRRWPVVLTGKGDQVLFDRQLKEYDPNILISTDAGRVDVKIRHKRTVALAEELAVLLSTSGSTGSPKMVKLTARNVHSNAIAIGQYLDLRSSDRAVTALKFNYSYGMSVINAIVAVGGSLLLTDRPITDDRFWQAMSERECTHFAGVPYSFEMLSRMDARLAKCTSLRVVTQAGGRLAPDLVQHFAALGETQGWKFYVMYGQTEASPRIAYLPPEMAQSHPTAIGRAIPGGSIDLIDENGSLIAHAGVAGELRYTGPNIFAGYATNGSELATLEISNHLFTGDIAQWNEAGLVQIVGRASRFVKPFGLRVSLDDVAEEAGKLVEGAIATGGDDQIIIGLLREHTSAGSEQTVLARLSSAYNLPAKLFSIVLIDEIPRLSNGKVDYKALTAIAAEQSAGDVTHASPRNGRLEWILSRNQVLTLLVSGLWHGAAWTFVAWGFIHGLLLVLQRQVGSRVRALYSENGWPNRVSIVAQIGFVFCAVAATRVLFRSPDVDHALTIYTKILQGPYNWGALDGKAALALGACVIMTVTGVEIAAENGVWRRLFRRRRTLRCAAVLLVFLVTLAIGEFEGGRFVYVRF